MSTPEIAFVGRGRELDDLSQRLLAGGVVLVSGPAGVGKTTLVEQAIRRAGAVAVRGHCPAEPAPPLWPWRTVLQRVGQEFGPEDRVETGSAASARLAALARLSDAVLAGGPLVVVLEDLHWADGASLDLLREVALGAADAGVCVVGTVRTPSSEDVALRLAGLGRYGATVLAIPPFTVDEVAQLVEPALADDVFARTGGLPLLVSAVRAGYGSSDVSTVVRALLGALSPAQRAVIEAAAVLGEDLDETLLSDLDDVAGALAAAWHAGLLTVSSDGHGYRFAHALIRDGVVARLEPGTRRRLARSAATALEAQGADQAGRIAALWRQAGSEYLPAVVAWSRRAAVQARTVHAYDDVVAYLTDALASSVDDPEPELLLELAHAEYLAGRYDRCLEHCVAASDRAASAHRADLVAASALVLQGVTFPQAGSVVSRLCQRALAYPDLKDGQRARLLAQLAVMAADAGQVARATEPAQQSLTLAAASGDPHAEIEAARARELTLVHPDDLSERLRLGELVVDRAETLGQPLAAVIGHEWRMSAGYLAGQLDTVESAAAAVEELANRTPLPIVQWHRHRMLASRAVFAGRFGESIEHSHRATAIARASGDLTAISMHFAHGVYLATLRGDPDGLPEGIGEAFTIASPNPLIDVQRANALALMGSMPEAREAYAGLCAVLPVPADHPAWVAVPIQLVDLIERFEDAASAKIVYRQLLPFRRFPGALGTATAFYLGSVSRHLGQLAAVAGDHESATELLREALERNRAIGAWPDTALTNLSLARVLRNRGDLTTAARFAQDAMVVAARLDMPGPVAAAGRLAADIARDRDAVDPLTSREREIAALVAQALSNRQIAAQLVLSERTVESHVRSILAKTQCANRTEFVARWAGN